MIDKEKVMAAVKLFLEGIGEDPNREGLLETPERVARMCEDIFGGMSEDPGMHLSKQFPAQSSELVIEKDITFFSTCEHHLLPFFGKAHIAYIPDGKVVGLSKLPRTVEVFARRPQIQEQMTIQIADAVESNLAAKGVMVMIEAEHTCLTMRGVKKPGTKTITMATRGLFVENQERQKMFLEAVKSC
ncbi:MAG: GTP cyclohydrolase I FolE [Oscillospiraceae bacterium]|nr:GTP cyclohydrolase I FolE [Oscillospiraceae bacterium]